jgi:ribosomal-protein-alanine N-acetyltransferase
MPERSASFLLRPLRRSDLGRLVRLERVCFPEDAYPRALFDELLDECAGTFLIAESEGVLAGYVVLCVRGARAELVSIAVRPQFRRKGIGDALLRRVIRIARRRGVARVSLTVRVENQDAAAFYRRFGFKRTGRIRRYYDNGGDGFRMSLRLATSSGE